MRKLYLITFASEKQKGSISERHKELLDLCLDVIYNNNMKAFGLNQLVRFYDKWNTETKDCEA